MRYRALALCLSALLLFSAATNAQTATHPSVDSPRALRPALPAPSGAYPIGRQAFDLVDTARIDPFSTGPGKYRELMVYIWYPAKRSPRPSQGKYFPDASELEKNPAAQPAVRDIFGSSWPLIASETITSHARAGAVPVTRPGGFPVVLFSHGSSATTFSYTAQIEDLVSHGYVVVAVEHTDAAGLVRFSDGRIRLFRDPPASPSAPKDPLQAMIASAKAGTQTGAEDISFVLDTLAEQRTPFAKTMDLRRVAAVGHSYGGTLTARACQIDTRIIACVSEDGEVNPVGAFFDYADHASIKQPFLLLEVANHPTDAQLARMGESRTQWNAFRTHEQEQLDACTAGSYLVLFNRPGMVHASFSDGPLLNAAPGSMQASIARGSLLLTDTLLRSFLDKYLKSESAPLLDLAAKTPRGASVEHIGR